MTSGRVRTAPGYVRGWWPSFSVWKLPSTLSRDLWAPSPGFGNRMRETGARAAPCTLQCMASGPAVWASRVAAARLLQQQAVCRRGGSAGTQGLPLSFHMVSSIASQGPRDRWPPSSLQPAGVMGGHSTLFSPSSLLAASVHLPPSLQKPR